MINDLSLASFAASATAHGRITFGDVRRLQRDHLPRGIETRADAATLMALAAEVGTADRSWRQWLAAALTDFATKSAADGATARDETIAWLDRLAETPGLARRISRKVARQLRQEAEPIATAPAAEDAGVEATQPEESAAPPAVQNNELDDVERRRRTRAAKRSRIVVGHRRHKRARPQRKLDAMPLAMMPTLWGWPQLMDDQRLQVPLAAPFR